MDKYNIKFKDKINYFIKYLHFFYALKYKQSFIKIIFLDKKHQNVNIV